MKRTEFYTQVALALDVNKVKAEEIVKAIEKVILDAVKSDPTEAVTFAGAEYGQKLVKGKSGVMNGVEWQTEDKMVGCVKAKSALKDLK
jgi:hypothetical protein